LPAQVLANAFGREESSHFTISQDNFDRVLKFSIERIRPTTIGMLWSLVASDGRALLNCSVSDDHKPLLLSNSATIDHLVDGLLLDPEVWPGPRNDTDEIIKARVQRNYTEALQQLAVSDIGRDALLQNPNVVAALETVAAQGLMDESRELAAGALIALKGPQSSGRVVAGQKHVMLSYQWAAQPTVKRINEGLQRRGYATWIDLSVLKRFSSKLSCISVTRLAATGSR
jgi:hypothetical protein